MNDGMKVLLAIVGVAVVSVLVVNGPKTAQVIQSVFGGFSDSLGTAMKG